MRQYLLNNRDKVKANVGYHYCFILTPHGWRNQGMVPDNDRQPFIDSYTTLQQSQGINPPQVVFVSFYWKMYPHDLPPDV